MEFKWLRCYQRVFLHACSSHWCFFPSCAWIKTRTSMKIVTSTEEKNVLVHTSQCYLWVNLKEVLHLDHAHCRTIACCCLDEITGKYSAVYSLLLIPTRYEERYLLVGHLSSVCCFENILREFAWMCFMNHDWLTYTKEQPFWVIPLKTIANYQWYHSINASSITVSIDGLCLSFQKN